MVLKAACMGPLSHRWTNLYWPCKVALTCPLLAHHGIVGWELGIFYLFWAKLEIFHYFWLKS